MKPYRLFLTFLFFLFVVALSYSQDQLLTGWVIDKETRNPIPNTAIFLSGTSIGCITDSSGNFTIKLPYTPCILIADHVSYEASVNPVITNDDLILQLEASVYRIGEIKVSGKNKRKRNLRFFYSHFIQENQAKIKLLNDGVLFFERDKMSFKASCSEPLVIENKILGYRISAIVEEFNVTVHDGPDGEQLPLNSLRGGEIMNLNGYFFYESLNHLSRKKEDKYEKNRRIAYYGSYRHFLKALYDNDIPNQGFIVESIPDDSIAFYENKSDNLLSHEKEYSIKADSLKVFYYYDDDNQPVPEKYLTDRNYVYQRISTIYPTKEPFIVRKNGTSPRLTFVICGGMKVKNFANSLPEDYRPD